MKQKFFLLTIIVLSIIVPQFCFAGITPYNNILDSNIVQVYAKAQHFLTITKQKKIRYVFSVINKSSSKVYMLVIGEKSLNNNDPAIILSPSDRFEINAIAPNNWTVNASRGEEPLASIEWEIPYELSLGNPFFDEQVAQPSFSTWDKYIIETYVRYPSIYKTYANVGTLLPKKYASTILKYDLVSPTATITSSVVPVVSKKGFYNINLLISAKDNYDPLPEITLDSIQDVSTSTTNPSPFSSLQYTLNTPNNIVTGLYPTVITIATDPNIAKKYKINYKIVDASDNQTIVSTIVTIPKQ